MTHYQARCPHCHAVVNYTTEMAGHLMLCPHCSQRFRLAPVKSPEPPPQPVPFPAVTVRSPIERAPKNSRGVIIAVAAVLGLGLLLIVCGGTTLLLSRIMRSPDPLAQEAVTPTAEPTATDEYLSEEDRQTLRELAKLFDEIDRKTKEAVQTGRTMLRPSSMKTGDVGRFDQPVLIAQVVGNNKFLGRIGGTQVLITLISEEELVDERYLDEGNSRWFYVWGPTTFTNVLGGNRTVMSVMEINPPKPARDSET